MQSQTTPHPTAPEMRRALAAPPDYSLFRFRAEVDFVEVRVRLMTQTNHWTLRVVLGATYVTALDPGPGNAATTFVVRFDDLASWATLGAQLGRAGATYGFAEPPRLNRIEIALDARMRDPNQQALALQVHRFFKFSKYHCSDNCRIGRAAGEKVHAAAQIPPAEQVALLRDDHVIWIGNKIDPESQRLYVKRTDRAGKVALSPDDWRARCELTLQGNALPFADLVDAPGFRFETLASRGFSWRTWHETQASPALLAMAGHRIPVAGVRARRGRRVYDAWTKADRTLNGRAYDALRGLTQRMCRPSPGRRRAGADADFPEFGRAEVLDRPRAQPSALLPI